MQRGKLNWAAQNALVQACGHGSKVGSMAGDGFRGEFRAVFSPVWPSLVPQNSVF